MNVSQSSKLSNYQRSVLKHMGISVWRSASVDEPSKVADPEAGKAPSMQGSAASIQDPNTALAGLQKIKSQLQSTEPSVTNEDVLLCFEASSSGLVNDVLCAVNLDAKTRKYQKDMNAKQLKGASFTWQFGENIDYTDNVLTTLPLANMTTVTAKKRLWQLLMNA